MTTTSDTLATARIAGLTIAAAFGIAAAVLMLPYDGGGGAILVILGVAVLLLLIVPGFVARHDTRFLTQLLIVGVAAKLVGTIVRLYVTFSLYESRDSENYHLIGAIVAGHIRNGDFATALGYSGLGTDFLEFFTGVVYSVIGPTLFGGFIFFSFLAVIGALFFYKAFRVASPTGDWRIFAVLMLLYPGIVYWPTGIGKDAFVFLFAGMTTYGVAVAVTRARWDAVVPIAIGLTGVFLVRPHIAMILAIGIPVALIVALPRRSGAQVGGQLTMLLLAAVATWIVMGQAAEYLGLPALSPDGVKQYVVEQEANPNRFEDNASNFEVTSVDSPLWAPMAFLTVLFRPFPWEAQNAQALVQSFDGILLAGIILFSARRLWAGLASVHREPFVAYAVITGTVLILALSTLGNFGLLARQRAMVLPFVFTVLVFAPVKARAMAKDADEVDSEQAAADAEGAGDGLAAGREPAADGFTNPA